MSLVEKDKDQVQIYLLGGAAVPNYGDELIVNNWLRWYSEQCDVPAEKIVVSGGNAKVIDWLFGARFPGIHPSTLIRQNRFKFSHRNFLDSVRSGMEFMSSDSDAAVALSKEIRSADVVHLYGGGYLNDKWPTHGFLLGVACAAKQKYGCKLVGTGLGLGPLTDPEDSEKSVFMDAFSAFDLLEVRDAWSYEYLSRNGVTNVEKGLDDAFLYPVDIKREEGPSLHISLRGDKTGQMIASRLEESVVESFENHYFWACTPDDISSFLELSKRFPFFNLLDVNLLLEGIPVGQQDFMITQRFHPHLMGARLSMNGVYRSGSGYYDVKHGSLVEIGSPFVEIELADLSSYGFEDSDFAKRDSDLVAEKRKLAKRIIGTGSSDDYVKNAPNRDSDEHLALRRLDLDLKSRKALDKRLSTIESKMTTLVRDIHVERAQLEQIRFNASADFLSEFYDLVTSQQLSFIETLAHIKEEKLSLARFGDGEIGMAVNPLRDIAFQRNSYELAEALRQILSKPSENLLVALPPLIYDTSWMTIYGRFWPVMRKLLPDQHIWGNAHVSRPLGFEREGEKLREAWMDCWANRDVTVVTGRGSRFEAAGEFFSNVKSLDYLWSSPKNAFEHLDEVKESILASRQDLVLLSLGPAGTVLSASLAAEGIQALDVGHLTSSYATAIKGAPAPERLDLQR